MKSLILIPLLLPLFMAAISLLARRWRFDRELLALVGAFAHFIFSLRLFFHIRDEGIVVMQAGGFAAPFGITLVADLMSATMLVVTGLIGFVIVLYSLGTVDKARQSFGYFPMLQILLFGCSGAFLAGDIFNLYVWFEVVLISSFVLLTLGGERSQVVGGVKYVCLNLIASAFFLTAIGLLYLQVGSLNFADVSLKISSLPDTTPLRLMQLLFLIAFLIKAAGFPFFFWLPASYHTPPIAVSALFAALLTKLGVYTLFRFSSLIFIPQGELFSTLLLWVAGLTMTFGVLGAWSQNDMRKILSFHIISQIGYMIMGIALFSPLALTGGFYFMLHNILAKTNLFLLAGVIALVGGSYQVKKLGGLFHANRLLAFLFLLSAMSLAGIPPLSGFFGKFALIKAGLVKEAYTIVSVSIIVSLVTLLSMLKIWRHAFWQDHPDPDADLKESWKRLGHSKICLILPVVLLGGLSLGMGIFADWFLQMSGDAAGQLFLPEPYIRAVLGGKQ